MATEIENLQTLLQKDPSNFQARRELSILLAQNGFNEEALSNLKYLSKYFPEDAEIWYNLGIQYEKVKDFKHAKKAYEKAIEINPQDDFYYNYGETLVELEEWDDALLAFQTVLKNNPKDGNTHFNLGLCYYKKEEIKSGFKQVNEMYHTVFPTEYVEMEQAGLFDVEEQPFEGEYVVFDVETTGLDNAKDEIIEIGACKIKNGKIIEVFSTFVKPSKKIPAEITELTGITEEMVADAPTINYILPDFYKFCYNTTIVAHNLPFDMGFIHNVAKKFSYNFNHSTMDTLEMSRKKIGGLKNYKLGTIVDHLGIVLENAHRAVNDATATAKVFIKLMQNYWFILYYML